MLGLTEIETSRRGRGRTFAACAASAALLAGMLLGFSSPAAADVAPVCGLEDCGGDDDGGADGDSRDGYVSIRVWGSGSTAGEDGYEIPGSYVQVLPPCYYFQWKNGVEAWEWYQEFLKLPLPEEDKQTTIDFEKHKDDEEGYWWLRRCSSDRYDGDDWTDFATDWYENNPPVYVFPTDPEPVPEIPPEFLVEVAYEEMELPEPEVSWNPQRAGDGATLVNVDTWFWLDDGPVELEVHASAGGNTATVEATLSEMGFSAPSAEPVTCSGFGVEWSPGASTDCYLVFTRSSAVQAGLVTPVQARSHWTVEWFANGEPRGALDPQTTDQQFEVPVAEVQSRADLSR